MKTSRRHLVALVVVLLAGCGEGGGPGASSARSIDPVSVADRYGYDIDSATLTPVYELVPQYEDERDGYARDLLAQRCLAGVVDYHPTSLEDTSPFTENRTLQPVFNEEVAAQWGYSASRLNDKTAVAIGDTVEITDEIQAAMVKCGERTDERLGTPPMRPLTAIESAGWAVVETDDGVRAAIEDWRQCMEPAGVVDLPADPVQMPPESVRGAGSTGTGDDPEMKEEPPSEREIEVAVMDARCQESAGYVKAVFRARATAELEAIGRDLEGFEAARRDYEEYDKKLDAVIDELG